MPENTDLRRRLPALGSAALACLALALAGPAAALAADEEHERREDSRASAALGQSGPGSEESPSRAALAGAGDSSSSAGEGAGDEREERDSTSSARAGRRDRDENRRRGASSGGVPGDEGGEARPSSRRARDGRTSRAAATVRRSDARAVGPDLDGLGDAIRRDTRARTEGIQREVRRAIARAERAAQGKTRDGASRVDDDEIVVSIASDQQIQLYPGGHHYRVRARVVVSGYEPPRRAGRTVVLQVYSGGRWVPVAHATTGEGGRFDISWYPRYPGRYQVRVRPYNSSSSIEPSGVRRIFVYRSAVASWYGPGFYGNRTACGQTFTNRLMGVAHRSLPCGYLVRVRYNGRMKTVPVVDRGPYIDGRDYDLTEALRNYLGFNGVDRVWVTA